MRFRNRLQTVAIVIEMLEAAANPANVESAPPLLCEELPRVLKNMKAWITL